MKTITLTVNLTFDSDITDDRDIQAVAQNVMSALVHEVEEVGISPDEADTMLTKIEVKEQFCRIELMQEF
jgi:hypothetical protein